MATFTVTVANAYVRTMPIETAPYLAIFPQGYKFTVLRKTYGFFEIDMGGYVNASCGIVEGYYSTDVEQNNDLSLEELDITTGDGGGNTTSNGTTTDSLITKDLKGIFGIPYQFLPNVDRRLEGSDFGRKYAEKIVSRMPLIFLTPGRQDFMSEYDKNTKKSMLGVMADSAEDGIENIIDKVIDKKGRYYTFKFQYDEYFEYVNGMCKSVAVLLGIQNRRITLNGRQVKIGDINWAEYQNMDFKSYFSAKENIIFYVDGASSASISESFSNDTMESSLVGQINGTYGSMAKEIQFLLGGTTALGNTANSLAGGILDTAESLVSKLTESISGPNIISSLISGADAVLSGGKLVFPELWSDSDRSASYDVSFKFRSPDHDNVSIFLNCIVPWIFLLAMTAPQRRSRDDDNSFKAPFLVRAFYKGAFNIDMGIITSLSCTKGREGEWNDYGLPTCVDVSMSIKDLYSSLFIDNATIDRPGNFIQNTALMDYLSNIAGADLSRPEIERQVKIWWALSTQNIKNLPKNIITELSNDVTNLLYKILH